MTEQKPNPRRLFVGNLSIETSAEDIGKLFEQQGEVEEALIVSRNERSLGFGFVTMKREEDAKKALEELKNYQLKGRTITVQMSVSTGPHPPRTRDPNAPRMRRRTPYNMRRRRPVRRPSNPNAPLSQTRIYVRNIPYRMRDREFDDLFKDYKVSDTLIIRDSKGTSRGYGFIECQNHEEQQKILAEHKTMMLYHRTATLEPAHERQPPAEPAQPAPQQ